MSRRLTAVAALAVVLGCAGCNTDSLTQSATDAASSAGDKLTSQTTDSVRAQLDAKKAELTEAAKRQAAELAAAADKALQEQIATATASAAASAKAQLAAAVASAVPSPVASLLPSPAPAVASTHTVTGTYTSSEVVDASSGSVPCATLTNVVGQAVTITAGTETVSGVLTACTWSAPGPLGSSPVFSLEVQNVPEAASYDIVIGDRTWQVSATTLAASGWKVALT
jgi:hypothetical protein